MATDYFFVYSYFLHHRQKATVNDNTTSTTPSTDVTADDTTRMQVDDEPILQINLRPDEVDHIDKLFAETMEDSIDPPETRYDPRYGLYPSTTEPILMALGPGDIEVAVAASIGSEVPAEEIVDNKTVRVDGEEQPSETPGDHKIC